MKDAEQQKRLFSILYYGVVVLLFYLVYRVFQPFLIALGWAVVLAVCFWPVHERLKRRYGNTRAAAISTAAVALLLVVPVLVLLGGIVRQGMEAARYNQVEWSTSHASLPLAFERAGAWLDKHVPGVTASGPWSSLREGTQNGASFLVDHAKVAALGSAAFLFNIFIVFFALFFVFRDADPLWQRIRALLPFDEAQSEGMLAQARDLIFASVTASLLIGAIQGGLGGICFALVGLPEPLFWGAVMCLLALLPVIGAWLVWVPATIWLVYRGEYGHAALVAGVCGVASGALDYLIRPLLLSGRAQMSSLVLMLSVLGGISAFGILGFILGPVVVALASSIIDVYTASAHVNDNLPP